MSLAAQIHADLVLCSLSLEFWSFSFLIFSHISRTIPSFGLGSVGLPLSQGMERAGHVQMAAQVVGVQPAVTAIEFRCLSRGFRKKEWQCSHSQLCRLVLRVLDTLLFSNIFQDSDRGKWQSRHSKPIHRDFQGGQSITASHRCKSWNYKIVSKVSEWVSALYRVLPRPGHKVIIFLRVKNPHKLPPVLCFSFSGIFLFHGSSSEPEQFSIASPYQTVSIQMNKCYINTRLFIYR